MIISRTPFRVSFAGGGSDLPAFYHREPGAVLSTAINKYMYIAIHPYFYKGKSLIKYSKTEIVNSLDERIEKIRETLNSINVMDILADQAGFQSYKNEELKNDDFYNKAKMLNKEFYDNLDVKFNEIENILNDLETNE